MENGATLATSVTPIALNRDLVLGKANVVVGYATGLAGGTGTITVGQLSAVDNNNKVVVSVASGTNTLSAPRRH